MPPTGYSVSNDTFAELAIRFGDKDGHIRVDDFLQCYIKLKTIFGRLTFDFYLIFTFYPRGLQLVNLTVSPRRKDALLSLSSTESRGNVTYLRAIILCSLSHVILICAIST